MINIRNFSIIAHIDHGKSTLADRILETTGSISRRIKNVRVLDTLELEQEKGITIKLQTARMKWGYQGKQEKFKNKQYILNLIDTPGHVDFNYEVLRSIAASEGVILLVDAVQGVQAQTVSNFYKALEKEIVIIPVISKTDLPTAQIEITKEVMSKIFGFRQEDILLTSGKTGFQVSELLDAIVEQIPPPSVPASESNCTKLLIFDSFFHEHKGVVALVKVMQGEISSTTPLYTLQTKTKINPVEIGYLRPQLDKQDSLKTGEVGFIATGLKDIKKIHVGDTIIELHDLERNASPLPGYEAPKPMVFASLYPTEAENFEEFSQNFEKLCLNDAAITHTNERSSILGSGYCCGFLGLLHLEITQERLSREFATEVFTTTPTVPYKLKLTTSDISLLPNPGQANFDKKGYLLIRHTSNYPRTELIQQAYEPWVNLEIITPSKYMSPIIGLAKQHRGTFKTCDYLSLRHKHGMGDYVILKFEIPSAEIIITFFDKLKSISRGYASMDYEHSTYKKTNIVKVTILINNETIEALSFITHRTSAQKRAKSLVEKLKATIPKQQFQVPIQAAISGKIIAREDIRAFRKDVTAKLYGGDVTRKKKLLEKQKKGKKRMKRFGKIEIPKEVFLTLLKTE